MGEQFNVNWETHTEHIKELFGKLKTTGCFSDVTLVCDDKVKVAAHKIVLCSCSALFASLLDKSDGHPIVFLRGIKHEEMDALMSFMYYGEATINKERMKDFLHAAIDLGIKEIDDHIDNIEAESDDEIMDSTQQTEEKAAQMSDDKADSEPVPEPYHSTLEQMPFQPTVKLETQSPVKDDPPLANHFLYKEPTIKRGRGRAKRMVLPSPKLRQLMPKGPINTMKITPKPDSSKSETKVDYICPDPQCELPFRTKIGLQCHIDTKHNNIKHQCNQCDHQASSLGNLKKHIQVIHQGVRYPCKHCSYQATRPENLRSHIFSKHM